MSLPYTFDAWLARVNRIIYTLAGLDMDCLPDAPYRDWFDERVKPEVAAKRAVRRARGF